MRLGLAAALLALAGCAALRGETRTAGQDVSTEEVLATLPPEQRQVVDRAETAAREAERVAARADEAVDLAKQRVEMARAEVDARKAAVERAQAQVELVRRQHRAQLEGAPVSGQVPADVQAAMQRLDDAQYAVDVARWEEQRAEAVADLRRAELAYAEAFRGAARELTDMRSAEVELAKAQAVSRATPEAVPGVVDPRVARAQAGAREAQADYARAHAEATQELADVQVRQRAMARFDAGPPERLAGATAGQSGAALAPQPQQQVELEPLPWPSPWQPGRDRTQPAGGGASGGESTPQQ